MFYLITNNSCILYELETFGGGKLGGKTAGGGSSKQEMSNAKRWRIVVVVSYLSKAGHENPFETWIYSQKGEKKYITIIAKSYFPLTICKHK